MNYSIKLTAGILFIFLTINIYSQESKLLPDKQGAFSIINWSVYGMSGTNYTKTETEANYKKLVEVTDVIRKNPVIGNPKGFDCNARLYGMQYDKRNGYGIPCQFSLEFSYFFVNNKGKEVKANIEPPNWNIRINRLNPFTGVGFGLSTPKPTETPKAGFNYEEWDNVGERIRDLIYVPAKKETLERGIDRYDDYTVVIYNPDNPPYWLPVTIREAFTLLIDYWKLHPDQIQSEMAVKMLEEEYAQFSENDRKGYAYSGMSPFANIGSDSTQKPIMRINKNYWNRKLPRSAIQIISFECPADENFILNEMHEKMQNNGGSYHINRFLLELEMNSLLSVIDK